MPYLGNSISKFTTADDLTVSGDADIDGTANLDVVDIDGAVDMASTLAVSGASTFSSDIDVQGSAGATLKLTSTDTSGADTELLGQIDFVSSDSSTGSAGTQARIKGVYEDNGDSSGIAFLAGASTGSGTPTISEVMRIRHEGRVGIGEDNPATTVHITASAPALSLNTAASMTSGNRADINVYNSDRSGVGLIRFGAVTDNVGTNMQFYTRPASGSLSERMRVTSDGSFLVGTSSYDGSHFNDTSGGGFAVKSDGKIDTKCDGTVANFNMTASSGGNILYFAHEGTGVGSIGIQTSGFYIDGESGHEGIRFANGAITPRENGSDSDGASDLGASNNQFKDGYFTGTVFAEAFTGRADTDTAIQMTGSNIIKFFTNSTERMRLDQDGKL